MSLTTHVEYYLSGKTEGRMEFADEVLDLITEGMTFADVVALVQKHCHEERIAYRKANELE